jgi:hypothetical protein
VSWTRAGVPFVGSKRLIDSFLYGETHVVVAHLEIAETLAQNVIVTIHRCQSFRRE